MSNLPPPFTPLNPDPLTALKRRTVREIEVGGVRLFVRSMSVPDRLKLRAIGQQPDFKLDEHMPEIAAAGVCLEDGTACYSAADFAALDPEPLGEIVMAVLEASGLTDKAAEDAQGN